MQIDHHLDAVLARPFDSSLQVWQLTGNVRLSCSDFKRPVPDGNADVIQSNQGL